ncbi:unnamed protein product [Phaeothamnion confervicola]
MQFLLLLSFLRLLVQAGARGGPCAYAVAIATLPDESDIAYAAFFAGAIRLAEPACDVLALVASHLFPSLAAPLQAAGITPRAADLAVPLRAIGSQDLHRSILSGSGWDLLQLSALSLTKYERVIICGSLRVAVMAPLAVAATAGDLLPLSSRDWTLAVAVPVGGSGPLLLGGLMVARPSVAAAESVARLLSMADVTPWLFQNFKRGVGRGARARKAASVVAPVLRNAVAAARLQTASLPIGVCPRDPLATAPPPSADSGSAAAAAAWCEGYLDHRGTGGGRVGGVREGGKPIVALLPPGDPCVGAEKLRFLSAAATEEMSRLLELACSRDWRATGAPAALPPPPPPLAVRQSQPAAKITLTSRDLKAMEHFFLVNEQYKLLMLAIPKAGSSQVHQLFLRLHGSPDWNSGHIQQIHFHRDISHFKASSVLSPQRATEIFNDPSWTRAVLFRDPATRLLSAFLDKFVMQRSYGQRLFKSDMVSFEMLVALLHADAPRKYGSQFPPKILGLGQRTNPHWREQASFFALPNTALLPYFNFVGRMEHAEAHGHQLLEAAGLWERFGASGWGAGGGSAFLAPAAGSEHATAAEAREAMYYGAGGGGEWEGEGGAGKEGNVSALLADVRRLYAEDYTLLERLFGATATAASVPPTV